MEYVLGHNSSFVVSAVNRVFPYDTGCAGHMMVKYRPMKKSSVDSCSAGQSEVVSRQNSRISVD